MIDFLRDESWTILHSENYSLRDQIALFSNAKAICAVHGAGLTNLLWCQPGCKVLELCSDNYLNGCYEGLASYLDLNYRYKIFASDQESRPLIDYDEFVRTIRSMDIS